jgi:hypothetical protein
VAGDGRVVLSWRSGEDEGVSFIFHTSDYKMLERIDELYGHVWDGVCV